MGRAQWHTVRQSAEGLAAVFTHQRDHNNKNDAQVYFTR